VTSQERLKAAQDQFAQDMAASLCTAAAKGNAAELERRLAATPTADLADYDGRRALHLAAANGEVACCQALLRHGADASKSDNFGTTPLLEAVQARLAAPPSRKRLALDVSCGGRPLAAVLYISPSSYCRRQRARQLSWQAGSDDVVRVLLDAGARLDAPDAGGMLCRAASSPRGADRLARLLAAGIAPDACDYDRRTALHLAAAEVGASLVERYGYGITRSTPSRLINRSACAMNVPLRGGRRTHTRATSRTCGCSRTQTRTSISRTAGV